MNKAKYIKTIPSFDEDNHEFVEAAFFKELTSGKIFAIDGRLILKEADDEGRVVIKSLFDGEDIELIIP